MKGTKQDFRNQHVAAMYAAQHFRVAAIGRESLIF